jgi:transcriptional regulator with PAS, ATPase and Fis domain
MSETVGLRIKIRSPKLQALELIEQVVMELDFLTQAGIVGDSPAMKDLAAQIDIAARSDLTVLVSGESGTGKELVTRAIHRHSARGNGPLVSFNCGAITESLLESELFGYVRGAFTGADRDRTGLFRAADAGTLFLDEVGEMSLPSQAKLLRVLQEHTIRPVGGVTEIPVDVRVVAATNRNLPQEVQRGRFRQDLFYRLSVLTIHIPPLRERVSDIRSLTKYFLCKARTKLNTTNQLCIHDDAIGALARYTWPGNVRQLRHVVERLAIRAANVGPISASDVSQVLDEIRRFEIPSEFPLGFRENDSLDEFLARTTLGLYNHFRAVAGNHSEVARILGIHRNTLYLRVERARRILRCS